MKCILHNILIQVKTEPGGAAPAAQQREIPQLPHAGTQLPQLPQLAMDVTEGQTLIPTSTAQHPIALNLLQEQPSSSSGTCISHFI